MNTSILIDQPSLPLGTSLVAATLLTGVYDVNRGENLEEDNFKLVSAWYDSLNRLGLRGLIFHNTFSATTVARYQTDNISFVQVKYDHRWSPNVFRYMIYEEFLDCYSHLLASLFVSDIVDVEVIQNPFEQPQFLANAGAVFCGDEPEILDNPWMHAHGQHLRQSLPGFASFEFANRDQVLLNCGIIGGQVETMRSLMNHLAQLHRSYTLTNKTAYTLDMGAFNFVARTHFGEVIQHGTPINTRFKAYEYHRQDCWFRHK